MSKVLLVIAEGPEGPRVLVERSVAARAAAAAVAAAVELGIELQDILLLAELSRVEIIGAADRPALLGRG